MSPETTKSWDKPRRFSGVAQDVAVPLGVYIKQNADARKAGQHRRTSKGNERERDAGDRHDADRHADVNQDMKEEHADQSGGEQKTETVAGGEHAANAAVEQAGIQH